MSNRRHNLKKKLLESSADLGSAGYIVIIVDGMMFTPVIRLRYDTYCNKLLKRC